MINSFQVTMSRDMSTSGTVILPTAFLQIIYRIQRLAAQFLILPFVGKPQFI